MTELRLTRVGPLVTVQDAGRPGMRRHGIAASGPMDRSAFARAGTLLDAAGPAGIEFTTAGLAFRVDGAPMAASFDGGDFTLRHNHQPHAWPSRLELVPGDLVDISPGAVGNYGYVRFDREMLVPPVLGSRSTHVVAGLGGLGGRCLRAGDLLAFGRRLEGGCRLARPASAAVGEKHLRIVWGIHADLFPAEVRRRFVESTFTVSASMDRMGARLIDREGVFTSSVRLSLISDAIVPGDIQILGDGTPIILLRDHQPTGGYARIATVISADLDRFVQMRPGTVIHFCPVTLDKAHAALKDCYP